MKQSLTALAVLSMFAGASMAAEVTMYGVIDTGFQYSNVDDGVSSDISTFEMATGTNSTSRFGLKGSDDLGNYSSSASFWKTALTPMTANSVTVTPLLREALVYLDGAWARLAKISTIL